MSHNLPEVVVIRVQSTMQELTRFKSPSDHDEEPVSTKGDFFCPKNLICSVYMVVLVQRSIDLTIHFIPLYQWLLPTVIYFC